MASGDDLNSTTKGQALSVSQLAAWAIAPGQTLSSTASPKATVVTVGTTSTLLIASSTTRRGLEFINGSTGGNPVWVMPQGAAVVGQGYIVVPGGFRRIPNTLAANAGFSAIATGAAGALTVVEYF